MGDERVRSEIREEQERIISAVRSAGDHWEMAKAQAAAHALRQSAAANEHRYVTGLSGSADD